MAATHEAQDMGGASLAHDAGPVRDATGEWDESQVRACSAFEGGPWTTFYDLLPDVADPFIYSTDGRRPLSFSALKAFLLDEKNDVAGLAREDRLCTALPNGPESAVSFLVFALRCAVAPLNLFLRGDEFEFEFDDLPAKGLVVQKKESLAGDEIDATGVAIAGARRKKLQIVLQLVPSPDTAGLFTLEKHAAGKALKGALLGPPLKSVSRDHVCLVLHTSGTTKKPKIVPITHGSMAVGCKCHAAVNMVTSKDVFLNSMPMFHIAGLMENLLMMGMAGGRVVCLSGPYQPHIFYEHMMKDPHPTVYSAVPVQHLTWMDHAKEKERETGVVHSNHLKIIRNDSAALLPSLAEQMEEYLKAVVMPAYSMTEANPISSNPRFGKRKLKSVGVGCGPEVAIMAAWPEEKMLGPGEEGEVCVRGSCVMRGYEMREHMDQDPNTEAFTAGWMRSGDKGWRDEDGYLYLVGRFKELINRAGEKVSPFEIEDAVRKHEAVQDVLCFAAPHEFLGETVGVVLVLKPQASELKLFELRKWLGARGALQDKWWPDIAVTMPELPKGPTGKPARINLWKKLGIEPLKGELVELTRAEL